MTVGVMQPYFFPYIGYFELIARTDKWVVFDVVKYAPQSWMNRNRVLHPENGWRYIGCRINKAPDNTNISDIRLQDPKSDGKKIIGQLAHYKKKAPYYSKVIEIVESVFLNLESDYLVDLNVSSLAAVCHYLDMPFSPIIASKSNMSLPHIEHAGQWSLEITALLGGDTYINPPNGKPIFKPEEFKARGITLAFTKLNMFRYECPGYTFEPHLSIIDVLMWNGREAIKEAFFQQSLEYA